MVRLPVSDADGYPTQKRGVSDYPGLYFVGLPWLHNAKSGILFGVAQDAAHIASAINAEAFRLKWQDTIPSFDVHGLPLTTSEYVEVGAGI
jgi:hypothetical protein